MSQDRCPLLGTGDDSELRRIRRLTEATGNKGRGYLNFNVVEENRDEYAQNGRRYIFRNLLERGGGVGEDGKTKKLSRKCTNGPSGDWTEKYGLRS